MPRFTKMLSSPWVTTTAVNMDVMTLMESVMAKPLMEPVPNHSRTSAAMIVVTLESMIAESALLKPFFTEENSGRPAFSSSRMRSKMMTFASTAMPMPKIMPATPGSVSCAPVTASRKMTSRM